MRILAASALSLAFLAASPTALAQERGGAAACPLPQAALVLPDGKICSTRYSCSDGTIFLFPENYVWEEGEYSILVEFGDHTVSCRGEISMAACSSGITFVCDGFYKASVQVEGCPIPENIEDKEFPPYEGDILLEPPVVYQPAQERPYIARMNVAGAADKISVKISHPVKIVGNFALPRTLHTQVFTGHRYKTYEPNGAGCSPSCRYGAELVIKGMQ